VVNGEREHARQGEVEVDEEAHAAHTDTAAGGEIVVKCFVIRV
jgi:hypothetical protein